MPAGAGRQLRPVGDKQHLPCFGQGVEFFCKFVEGHAADASVNLVKNKGSAFFILLHAGKGQQKARKFAARGNFIQWLRGLTRVGSPQNAATLVLYPGPDFLHGKIGDNPHLLRKAQLAQLVFKAGRNGGCGLAPCRNNAGCHSCQLCGKCCRFLVQPGYVQSAYIEKRKVLCNFFAQGQNFWQGAVQLALELGKGKKALFQMVHVGHFVQAGQSRGPAKFAAKVGQLLAQGGYCIGIGLKRIVLAGHAHQEFFELAELVDHAFLLIALQQNKGLLVVFLLVLHGTGQRAYFFKAFFFAFFGRNLVYFLLLHFKQFAPLHKARLPIYQGRALGGVCL